MFLPLAILAALNAPVHCVAMAPHFEGEATVAELSAEIDAIVDLGANTLMMVVQWGQRDVASVEIGPYQWGTDDAKVAALIAHARNRGLEVLVFPILKLAEIAPGRWRGTLRPVDLDAWWSAYTRFVLHYARLAGRAGASVFSVGSELGTMERYAARWRALIRAVRTVFPGRLVYSANWDHFTHVAFWPALDLIGINAYHPITTRTDPPEAELRAAWAAIRTRLLFWHGFMHARLLFTEMGYPSVVGGARRPYDYGRDAPASVTEQTRAYRAFIDTWRGQPGVAGACVWLWTGRGGAADRGYMPRGKPAELLLRSWFGRAM